MGRDMFSKIKSKLSGVLTVLMLTLCIAGTAFSVSGVTAYATDTEVVDTTFYTMSSAAAGYLSDYMARTGDGPGVGGSGAGGLLGYCDEANTSGVIIDFIQSAISSSSVTYSYEAISEMGPDYGNYANYGKILKSLGFDDTGNDGQYWGRKIAGGLLLGLYNMSTAVNYIFQGIVGLLKLLNPFRLIKWGGSDLITITDRGNGIEAIDAGPVSLTDYLSNFIDYIVNDFSWVVVIPASFGLLIFYFFLTKKDKMHELKKFLWRIAMIAFVVPVLGSLYTTSLDWLGSELDPDNGTPASRVIGSMLVDFEGWIEQGNNLSINETGITIHGLTIDSSEQQLDANISSLRETALRINRKAAGGSLDSLVIPGDSSDLDAWNESIGNAGSDVTDITATTYIRDLISRYMNADFYTPSHYQSYWKTKNANPYETSEAKTTIEDTNTLLKWTSDNASNYLTADDAGLWYNGNSMPWHGMTPMAMYNYLSTKFTDSGIEIYSNEKASSGFVRQFHFSVNMVGGGLTTVMSYINAVVMLGCLIVLAVCYGLGIMVASLKRTFRAITSMPLAALGSLRFGAKLIGNVLMMLVEVVVTLFMYSIAVSLLYGVMNIIDGIFSELFYSNPLGMVALSTLLPPTSVMFVEYLISTILYIMICIMLIRYRKKAVRGVDEMVADVINRLVPGAKSSDMLDTPKQSLPSKIAGAAGTAAGVVATQMAGNAVANAVKGAQPGDGQAPGEKESGGGNGDGGDAKEGDVNVENQDNNQLEQNDSDTMSIEDKEGDANSENNSSSESDEDAEGKGVMEADSLEDASDGTAVETGDEEVPDGMEDDEVRDAEEGDAQEGVDSDNDEENGLDVDGSDAAKGAAAGAAADGASNTGSAGQQAVKKAQADLDKSEQQKKNLESALKSSGKEAMAKSGSADKPMSQKEAQAGYANAMTKGAQASGEKPGGDKSGKGTSTGTQSTQGVPATVSADTKGAKAAETKKAGALTAAEAAAANNAANAIKDKTAAAGVKGAQALTAAQQDAIGKTAVAAAKAVNNGKLPEGSSADSIKRVANDQAQRALSAASPKATAEAGAMMGAQAVMGGKPMSADDVNLAKHTANEVRAAASAATSPEGLAKAAAMDAAKAANGGNPLTNSQYQAVQKTAEQAAADIQNAALSSAEATKGAPLTAAETAAIRQSCGVEAAQQAAVNAVEQCMETPLTDSQRAGLMDAAKNHVGSIMADNTQTRVAERAAEKAATAVRRANNLDKIPQKDFSRMMSSVRQQTQQTIAAAQPGNMAANAAVRAANASRIQSGQMMMNAQQTQAVANSAMNMPEIQQAFSGSYVAGTTESMMAQNLRTQSLSSGAANARQTYDERASQLKSQTQQNYREIEAMKAQLAARGYSKQQINAIAHGENRARQGEHRNVQGDNGIGQNAQRVPQENGQPRLKVKGPGVRTSPSRTFYNDGVHNYTSAEYHKMRNKEFIKKRELGKARDNDQL